MNQRRKFRPSVDGMEQRLALNGAFSTIQTVAHQVVVDAQHMGGLHADHHTGHHAGGHTGHHAGNHTGHHTGHVHKHK